MKVLNAWSMSMVEHPAQITTVELDTETAAKTLADSGSVESSVGHADAAKLYSAMLGIEIPMLRGQTVVAKGETVLIGQYMGPRLPEGAIELPEGARIVWLLVTVS